VKITGFDIYVFSLPFSKTFSLKGNLISKREGLLIRLTSLDGVAGFGEISPLPGFSRESLKEARQQVLSLRLEILNKYTVYGETLFRNTSHLFPSVRFGFETAVLNLLASHNLSFQNALVGNPDEAIIRPPTETFGGDNKNIPIIGLLGGSIEDVVSEAQRMRKEGFRSFKLKVGSKNMAREIEKVRRVQDLLKNQGTLRLDANRFWKFEEALRFGKALKKKSIEYIEEPFKNISTHLPRVTEFFKKTGIPVALDESLSGMNPKNFKPLKGLKAFILKPTILGGIEKTRRWIQRAKALKVQAVISSAFESGVGLSMLAQLAASFDGLPAGLDTYKYFSKDLLIKPLQMDRGSFIIPPWPLREENLDFTLLTRCNE